MAIFVGLDWAEERHEVALMDAEGAVLRRAKVSDDLEGLRRFHELAAEQAVDNKEIVVGTETDRGLFIGALVAAGYTVSAVNPFKVARHRERFSTSGAKSDPGDAVMLADMVRTDAHKHRQVAGDSDLAEAVKIIARAHQSLIWARQHQANVIRSTLREYYPAALVAFTPSSCARPRRSRS